MIFYCLSLIDRIITGDTLFGIAIWSSAVIAYFLTSLASWSPWKRFLYFVALSFALMMLSHIIVDAIQVLYVTPLGEHMDLDMP